MPAVIYGNFLIFGVPDGLPVLPPGSTVVPDPDDFLRIVQAGDAGRVYYVGKEGAVAHEVAMPLQVIELPAWTVRVGSSPDATHELHFRQQPQSSMRGQRGRDLLIQLAVLLNRKAIAPEEWCEAADDARQLKSPDV
jgi:hypothetical protein